MRTSAERLADCCIARMKQSHLLVHSQFGNPMYVKKTQTSANLKILSSKKWSSCKFDE